MHKVDDLIVNATVKGSARGLSIGRGTKQDVFLDTTAPGRPVLYHDFDGNDWVDRLRRKVAPALAALVENPAYGATLGCSFSSSRMQSGRSTCSTLESPMKQSVPLLRGSASSTERNAPFTSGGTRPFVGH